MSSKWTSVGLWTLPSRNRVSVRARLLPDGNWYGDAQWAYVPSVEDLVHYSTVLRPDILDRMNALAGDSAGIVLPYP